mgnify:CR=1 FL=1
MKRRCVVIGCGWAGQYHARTVSESAVAELVALVEPSPIRAKAVGAEHGVPVYADLESVLAGERFDTAIVATLPTLHYEQVRRLLESGKDILCEKPLCRSSEEIRELKVLAEARGLRLGVVFNQRYGHAVQKAKELLKQDATPRHLITASMYQDFPKSPGGHIGELFLLTDSCCHLLDLMTYLAGPAMAGLAIGSKNELGVYTDVTASLRFMDGGVGSLTHSAYGGSLETQHPFQRIDIHTEQARYCVESCVGKLTVYPHGSQMRETYIPPVFEPHDYGVTMTRACRMFLNALHDGSPLPASAEDAYRNMVMIETLCDSMIR